jgi:transcriptional regulator with XRE-family HTH domain
MVDLKTYRSQLRISQSALARLAKVSRFRIWNYEIGSGSLTEAEQQRIQAALVTEAERLQNIGGRIDFGDALSA